MLVLMAGIELPVKAIREQIAGGFDLLVHISRPRRRLASRDPDHGDRGHGGRRRDLQDLFVARPAKVRRRTGSARAARATGLRPNFLHKLMANGVDLPSSAWLGHA
jgi:pilus assembly protein CpaF